MPGERRTGHQFSVRLPLVEEISPPPEIPAALAALVNLPAVLLLESALVRERLARRA